MTFHEWLDSQIQLERENLRSALRDMASSSARLYGLVSDTDPAHPLRLPEDFTLTQEAIQTDGIMMRLKNLQELKVIAKRLRGGEA